LPNWPSFLDDFRKHWPTDIKGEPVNWWDIILITGSDVDLEDLRGGD
jgi:hypothetical protein